MIPGARLAIFTVCVVILLVCSLVKYAGRDGYTSEDSGTGVEVAYYINLDRRADRKEEFLSGMRAVGFPESKLTRVPAVDMPGRGDLGCSRSHIRALEMFMASPHRNCIVFEDDFTWTPESDPGTLEALSRVFRERIEFDVCMLSANTVSARPSPYPFLQKVESSQTASGYMVSRRFAAELLENFRAGAALLHDSYQAGTPDAPKYAVDQYWKRLQPEAAWYVFTPKLGKQRESFSDIQGGVVNYEVFTPDEFATTSLAATMIKARIVKPNVSHDLSLSPGEARETSHFVPAKIHFIWIGSPIPQKYIENIERFVVINSPAGYKLFGWTDHPDANAPVGVTVKDARELEERMANKRLFESEENMGARADMMRYEIVYLEGGIYTDVDVVCLRAYDRNVFDKPFVTHTFQPYNNISNAVFGFPVRSEFLRFVIQSLPSAAHRVDVPSRTGPMLFTQCFVAFADTEVQMIHQSMLVNDAGFHDAYTVHTNDANWMK